MQKPDNLLIRKANKENRNMGRHQETRTIIVGSLLRIRVLRLIKASTTPSKDIAPSKTEKDSSPSSRPPCYNQ